MNTKNSTNLILPEMSNRYSLFGFAGALYGFRMAASHVAAPSEIVQTIQAPAAK